VRNETGDGMPTIFWRFLKFGMLAWGGPAAQIAMIKRECVDQAGWVDEETFKKTLAVYQVLPGPEAHELCVYFGRLRGGRLGGLLAGLGFMLPGFVLMLGLSALYFEADLGDELAILFYGLSAAVVALLARALVRLGSAFITDLPLALIALAALLLTLFSDASFVLVLIGAGLLYELRIGALFRGRGTASIAPQAVLFVAIVGGVSVALVAQVFLEGLKAGLLTFGGAYTVIPFLQESAVGGHGWVTQQQFIEGIALGGVLPAPAIIFSTFVGYGAAGLPGALAITLGIFVPAFVFPILLHRQLVAIAENTRVRPFLLGVAAAVIGLIAAVAIEIGQTSIVDIPSAVLAVVGFVILNRFHSKLTVLYVVLGCGIVGALLQLTVL
jgi:chromate transporter